MLKIKSFLLVLVLSLGVIAPCASLQAQNPPAPKPSVLMGVLGDLGWAGKAILSGLWSAAHEGAVLWNAHMTKEKLYCVAGISAAWAMYNYYSTIRGIHQKYKNSQKLCVWGMRDWDSHVRMRLDQSRVLAQLKSAYPMNVRQNQAAWGATMVAIIDPEIQELQRDMKNLEDQFLTFFKIVEYLPGCKPLGIERNYIQIEKQMNPQETEEVNWSEQQFYGDINARTIGIDRAMKNAATLSWWHPLCFTVNYGNAAYVWWELKKMLLRLELLKFWLTPVQGGVSNTPNINMGDVNIGYNQHTFRPAVRAQ